MSRVEANKQIPESDFEIIGEGEIGDKAKQLIDKTPLLRSIGFRTPHRIVLAQGFFDSFFQRNRLGKSLTEADPVPDLEARIENGSFSAEDINILQREMTRYDSRPLIIRSSGQGDTRGTGTYKSVIAEGTMQESKKALLEVLASYFSPSAIAFRYDAHTGEGFGIMIEPLIGQDFDYYFAPSFSGYGYTSTVRGAGYINVVPGLGGGVESRAGERLTEERISEYKGLLDLYIEAERGKMLNQRRSIRRSALLRTDQQMPELNEYSGLAYFPPTEYRHTGEMGPALIKFEGNNEEALDNTNLLPLFTMMKQMEEKVGKPQYFEWAMTLEGKNPIWWITQIADVDKKLDLLDFENFGKVMFIGHTVTGTGIIDCSKIVYCWNSQEIQRLNQFNRHNKAYVLLYSSRLTTSIINIRKMSYEDFSNASVFLEIDDAGHSGSPVAHLEGQLELAGKLFGVLDYEAEVPSDIDEFSRGEKEEYGLRVYQGKTKVVASEKQNRMVVYAVD